MRFTCFAKLKKNNEINLNMWITITMSVVKS